MTPHNITTYFFRSNRESRHTEEKSWVTYASLKDAGVFWKIIIGVTIRMGMIPAIAADGNHWRQYALSIIISGLYEVVDARTYISHGVVG